jgi:hypothetical protein
MAFGYPDFLVVDGMVFAAVVWHPIIQVSMKKWTFFFLVMSTALGSCQLQKVMVSVYTPPKLVFPPEVKTVLVTSRYVPATGPYEDVQWGAFESVDSLKWKLSESVIDTLAKRMTTGNRFLIKVKHFPRMLRNNDANLPEALPWEGLSALAKKEYIQSLLVIEGFDLKKTPVVVTENNNLFLAKYSVGVTLAIRVYQPERMRTIDDSVYTFSTEFQHQAKTQEEAVLKLPDGPKALFAACSNAADQYYALIKPGEILSSRKYFSKGDSTMLKADLAVKEGKWGRAESKWNWLAYNSKDSLVQAKASFNMALACERDGRLNQAIGFARRSQRIHPEKHTLDYINVLNKRLSDYENQVHQKKIIRRW